MTEQLTQLPTDQLDLPPSVREAYGISHEAVVERLTGGLVNDTMLVRDQDNHTILRRLSGITNGSQLADARVVSAHLIAKGWEAPGNLPTLSGQAHMRDESDLTWHRMPYIPSDCKTPQNLGDELARNAGRLVGGWHNAVQDLDYVPRFDIPHFHDTPYIAAKLTDQLSILPDTDVYGLANTLLDHYRMLPDEPTEVAQIIHGDPKLDNMLFRDGKPFTLIDFDDIMRGSRWTDVGDFLRSMTGKLLQQGQIGTEPESFVVSYHESVELTTSVDEATSRAHQATGRIALELGMRYVSDIVDKEKYFSWDPIKHESRRDNHAERAELQLEVARHALKAA